MDLDIELGDSPVVVPRNHQQFKVICRALGLNPHRTISGLNLRALEGLRPTSVIYGPDWQDDPDWERTSQVLDRLMIVSRVRPPVAYLSERDLRESQ